MTSPTRTGRSLAAAGALAIAGLAPAGEEPHANALSAADPQLNQRLIAAMPPATESVVVYRYDLLLGDDSHFKSGATEVLAAWRRDAPAAGDIPAMIRAGISEAGPVAQATGGSMFGGPPPKSGGIGAGSFIERSIYLVRHSVHALRQQIEDLDDAAAQPRMVEDLRTYKAAVPSMHEMDEEGEPVIEHLFIAFPDDHTILATEHEDDLQHVIKSLRRGGREMPPQWRDLASHIDLSSPIVVLRRYNPENAADPFSPVNPRIPKDQQVDIVGHAAALPDADSLTLHLFSRTSQPANAKRLYRQFVGTPTETWNTTWQAEGENGGFSAEIPLSQQTADYIFLRAMLLFGQYVGI